MSSILKQYECPHCGGRTWQRSRTLIDTFGIMVTIPLTKDREVKAFTEHLCEEELNTVEYSSQWECLVCEDCGNELDYDNLLDFQELCEEERNEKA